MFTFLLVRYFPFLCVCCFTNRRRNGQEMKTGSRDKWWFGYRTGNGAPSYYVSIYTLYSPKKNEEEEECLLLMVFKWRSLFFFVLGIYPRPSVSALDMEMKRNEGESHKLLIVLFFPLKKNSTEQRGLENETTKSCCFSESRRQLSGGPCRLFRKFFFLLSFTCVSEEIEFKMACLWYKTTPATNETRGREKVLGRERVRVQRTTYIYTALFSLTLVERELPPLSLFLSLFFLTSSFRGRIYISSLTIPPFFLSLMS